MINNILMIAYEVPDTTTYEQLFYDLSDETLKLQCSFTKAKAFIVLVLYLNTVIFELRNVRAFLLLRERGSLRCFVVECCNIELRVCFPCVPRIWNAYQFTRLCFNYLMNAAPVWCGRRIPGFRLARTLRMCF